MGDRKRLYKKYYAMVDYFRRIRWIGLVQNFTNFAENMGEFKNCKKCIMLG